MGKCRRRSSPWCCRWSCCCRSSNSYRCCSAVSLRDSRPAWDPRRPSADSSSSAQTLPRRRRAPRRRASFSVNTSHGLLLPCPDGTPISPNDVGSRLRAGGRVGGGGTEGRSAGEAAAPPAAILLPIVPEEIMCEHSGCHCQKASVERATARSTAARPARKSRRAGSTEDTARAATCPVASLIRAGDDRTKEGGLAVSG